MSGIVAVLAGDGAAVDPAVLAAMTATMRRRGPDAERTWTRGPAGLGHTLLDTAAAPELPQPATLDSAVWIAADARIDAQAALRTSLRTAGRDVAPGASDAALVLHAYAAWGVDCAAHLLGDYAFALWDAPRGRLVAARSGFGAKPLFWARVAGALLVSNTIPALLAHPVCSDTLDERWLADFLVDGLCADPEATVFSAVRRVLPGHTLVAGTDLVPQLHRHWRFPDPESVRYRRADDVVSRFRELLDAAVLDRVRVPDVAIFLSGGLDSPAIATAAHERLTAVGGTLHAYTIVLDHLAPDEEGHYAALVARALGVPQTVIAADGHELLDARGRDAPPLPEPVDDPLVSIFHELAGVAATRSRIGLHGEDGDALLRPPGLRTMLHTVPWTALLWDVARYRVARGRMPHLGVDLRRRLRQPFASATHEIPSTECPAWLRPSARQLLDAAPAAPDPAPDSETRRRRPEMYAMLTSPLWPAFLESVDPGFTGLPFEVRFPLLDERLIAFIASIPPVPWCQQKTLLRVAMRDQLPAEVLQRPKAPVHGDMRVARLRQAAARLSTPLTLIAPLNGLVDVDALPSLDDSSGVDLAWRALRVHIVNRWLQFDLPRLRSPAPPVAPAEPLRHAVDHSERRRVPRSPVA